MRQLNEDVWRWGKEEWGKGNGLATANCLPDSDHSMPLRRRNETVQVSIRLPRNLREEIQRCLKNKSYGLTSLNDLAIKALTVHLRILRRAEVDAGIAEMANDEAFKRETARIMKEFEHADAEAFRLMAKKGQI